MLGPPSRSPCMPRPLVRLVVKGLGHPAAGCGKQFPRAASWPGTCISVRRTRVAGFLPNLDRRSPKTATVIFLGAGPKPRAWVVPTLNFKLVFTFGPSAAVPCGSPLVWKMICCG
jgi:hypothetical protein